MNFIRCNLSMNGLVDREKTFPLDLSFLFDERAQRMFLPVGKFITLSGIFQKKITQKSGVIAVMADCRISIYGETYFIGHMYWTSAEALTYHASGDYITAFGKTYLYEHKNEKDLRFKTSVGFQILWEM